MRWSWLAAALVCILAGCAAAPRVELQDVRRLDAELTLAFDSDVDDPYYVNVGPLEARGPFRVNDRLRRSLEEYTRTKTGAPSAGSVHLAVSLTDVRTGYSETGTVMVQAPNEITKNATLAGTAELHEGTQLLSRLAFEETAEEFFDRKMDAERARWVYDYTAVFNEAIRKVLLRVDALVDEARR